MKTLDDHFGVFATAALTAFAIGHFGNDDNADGAFIVAGAVGLYVIWVSFIRPRITRRAPETSDE